MPGGSGWDLIDRFADPSQNPPKFVVITGHEDEYSNNAYSRSKGGSNVVSFLTKPIGVPQLQAVLLAQRASAAQDPAER